MKSEDGKGFKLNLYFENNKCLKINFLNLSNTKKTENEADHYSIYDSVLSTRNRRNRKSYTQGNMTMNLSLLEGWSDAKHHLLQVTKGSWIFFLHLFPVARFHDFI
jgi:hypothetical protein